MEGKMEYAIIKEGFFFRAKNLKTGWVSSAKTSPSQCGLIIQRLACKEAHRKAAEAFLAR